MKSEISQITNTNGITVVDEIVNKAENSIMPEIDILNINSIEQEI